jgi:FkbM family methyltransferase
MKNPNVVISSAFGPVIINVNDTQVGKDIIQYGYWAMEDIIIIKSLLDKLLESNEVITFYDVGANIGTYALAIAKMYSTKVHIRAFEAQRNVYNMLCGNIAINGITNVFCHHSAVSNVDNDKIEIKLPDYGSANNFGGIELIEAKYSDNQTVVKTHTETVSTITIDSFDEKVDFIKMDIEGMEDKALLGAHQTISTYKPICCIEVMKTDKKFVVNFFRKLSYVGFIKNFDLFAIPIERKLQINELQRIF